MKLNPPRVDLVRNIIDSIGDGLYPGARKPPGDHKRVPYDIDNEKLRISLMYQYLIAGRAAEAAGKYRLVGEPLENAYLRRIGNYDAVIFPSKKGWNKHISSPILRGVCIPLDKGFEPWTREVFEYVTSFKDPFKYKPEYSVRSNLRILTATCEYIFNHLIWKSEWNESIAGSSDYEESDKDTFTNDSLYWLRVRELKHKYGFSTYDLGAFTKANINEEYTNLNNKDISWSNTRDIFLNTGESYFHRLVSKKYY